MMMRSLLSVVVLLWVAGWTSAASISVVSQSTDVFAGMDGTLGHVEDVDSTSVLGDIDLLAIAMFTLPAPNIQRIDTGATVKTDPLGEALSAAMVSSFNTTTWPDSEITESVSLSHSHIELEYKPQDKPTKLNLTTSGSGGSGIFGGFFKAVLTGPSDEEIFSKTYDATNPIVLDETLSLAEGRYILDLTADWTAGPDTDVVLSTEFTMTAIPLPSAIVPSLVIFIGGLIVGTTRRRVMCLATAETRD